MLYGPKCIVHLVPQEWWGEVLKVRGVVGEHKMSGIMHSVDIGVGTNQVPNIQASAPEQ